MTLLRSLLEWALILVPLIVIGFLGYYFLFGAGVPMEEPSGLPGNGGFFQVPLATPQQYSKNAGVWQFSLTANYAYTLAGKVVERHEYPATMPDGVIALDLAVANGDLLANNNLQYFTFTMGDRTLEYRYDVPTYTGLTEEYIDEHISNNHLVFLDPALETAVKSAKVGDCVIIKGKLVDIRGASPKTLYLVNTSTVRNDAYPAGCEIILVESYLNVAC
ncbi:MAG: hypothetical protein CVV32_02925 [Methanomicrobiales archaeon HGW-Methanomicrobiales-3]|jgi:hypothetical protein|nr:MAG: hypothetical protein CVV32_02925 [Methanomicrobiales archaeon HGW-Methanomicrobiales-3]